MLYLFKSGWNVNCFLSNRESGWNMDQQIANQQWHKRLFLLNRIIPYNLILAGVNFSLSLKVIAGLRSLWKCVGCRFEDENAIKLWWDFLQCGARQSAEGWFSALSAFRPILNLMAAAARDEDDVHLNQLDSKLPSTDGWSDVFRSFVLISRELPFNVWFSTKPQSESSSSSSPSSGFQKLRVNLHPRPPHCPCPCPPPVWFSKPQSRSSPTFSKSSIGV